MRQNDNSRNQGFTALPEDRATASVTLLTLSASLSSIHPADLLKGAAVLASFARAEMADPGYSGGHGGTSSAAEETAATCLALLKLDPSEFSGILDIYRELLTTISAYCANIVTSSEDHARQQAAIAARNELQRITEALGNHHVATTIVQPVPATRSLRQFLRDRTAPLVAVCVVALVWDLAADHFPLWQLLAALALVTILGGLVFRLGQRTATSALQTPVRH